MSTNKKVKVAEKKEVVEKKVVDKKEEVAEKKVAEKKVAEKKVAEKKVAEKKEEVAEKKVAEKKVADKKEEVAEKKEVEKKVSGKKVVEKKEVEKKEEVVVVEKKEHVKLVTNELMLNELSDLIVLLTESKESSNLKQGFKTLKSVLSRLKHVKNDLTKLLKKNTKNKSQRVYNKNTNSGLSKPVMISKELAKFMKVSEDSLQSRVSVTNSICSYIKDNNLQEPTNKRVILCDKVLSTLLNYEVGSDTQPLTYFYIQQLIQPHFLKEVSVELAEFMNVPSSSLQSSTTVNKFLKEYVTKHNLVKDDVVTPDEKLSKLLRKFTNVSVKTMNQLVKVHFK